MPIEELDWEDQERPGPQTESTRERGFASDVDESAFGRSEELDGEAGDIADEGPGHRG